MAPKLIVIKGKERGFEFDPGKIRIEKGRDVNFRPLANREAWYFYIDLQNQPIVEGATAIRKIHARLLAMIESPVVQPPCPIKLAKAHRKVSRKRFKHLLDEMDEK